MRRLSWPLVACLAIVAPVAFGQQQESPKQEPPKQESPKQGTDEGFFRPATDPALTGFPLPSGTPNPAAPIAPDAAALAAHAQAREALQRDLERAQREDGQARAEAARRSPPFVVSPLDGTAPILSPLDGTAPIVSPLGR